MIRLSLTQNTKDGKIMEEIVAVYIYVYYDTFLILEYHLPTNYERQ